jgi:hypothetical protein
VKTITLTLVLVGLFFVLSQAKLVPTPFGLRPEICVTRGVPSGSTIKEVEDGVLITHPTGDLHKIPKHQECLDYHNQWVKNNMTKVGSALDGWLDYASWYPPATEEVSKFTANYLVPPSPTTNSNQVLFYFIGTQNFQSTVGVTILQPVLTWGNGLSGWSYASWNCCPAGQQQESTPFQGFGPGDTLQGVIQAVGTNWEVISSWNGKSTQLTVADASRDFDWVAVTLETYSVTSCGEFPNGPMVVSDMVVTLVSGVVTPVWGKNTGATECNGVLTINSASEITIQHS